MGHKVNPVGFRIGVNRDWNSHWYAEKDFSRFLLQDIEIRKYLIAACDKVTFTSHIEIERKKNEDGNYKVIVYCFVAESGPVLGQDNTYINLIKNNVRAIVEKSKLKDEKTIVDVKIVNVENINLDANIVAKRIAKQLENRASFRAVQKMAIKDVKAAGAKGCRTLIGGRLGGADIARNEGYKDGIIPLHTLKSDIDFAIAEARTTYGRLGVKVWICRGDFKSKEELEAEKKNAELHKDDRRNNRGFRPRPPRREVKPNNNEGGNE